MYTVKIINSAGECVRWFTGTQSQAKQMRSLWLLHYSTRGCTVEVEPPLRGVQS